MKQFIGIFASVLAIAAEAAPAPTSSHELTTVGPLSPAEIKNIKEAARNTDTFTKIAAQDGLLEVAAGRLAESKATDSKVKEFGHHMVTDHQKANDDLEKVAKDKGIVLPTKLDDDHEAALDKLKSQSGSDFDIAYVRAMQRDHQKAVTLFKDASTAGGVDPEVQAFAKRTLPTLEEHRSMVVQLRQAQTNQSSQTKSPGG